MVLVLDMLILPKAITKLRNQERNIKNLNKCLNDRHSKNYKTNKQDIGMSLKFQPDKQERCCRLI